jgi:glucose dehydrogenase
LELWSNTTTTPKINLAKVDTQHIAIDHMAGKELNNFATPGIVRTRKNQG